MRIIGAGSFSSEFEPEILQSSPVGSQQQVEKYGSHQVGRSFISRRAPGTTKIEGAPGRVDTGMQHRVSSEWRWTAHRSPSWGRQVAGKARPGGCTIPASADQHHRLAGRMASTASLYSTRHEWIHQKPLAVLGLQDQATGPPELSPTLFNTSRRGQGEAGTSMLPPQEGACRPNFRSLRWTAGNGWVAGG